MLWLFKWGFVGPLFAMSILSGVTQAHAEPEPLWRNKIPQAQLVGHGDLRWFGFRIYTARLWVGQSDSAVNNSFANKNPLASNEPFALALTYHRNIKRAQFVDTSVEEIRRLFGNRYDSATLAHWAQLMSGAFKDVHAGDQLIGVFIPNEGCEFYSAHQKLAEIPDLNFAKAFFAIWFDERTKDKALRAQLLGATP